LIAQQPDEQLRRRRMVAPRLHDEVKDLAFVVGSPPDVHPLAAPHRGASQGGGRPAALRVSGDLQTELDGPAADCLIADLDAALGGQLRRREVVTNWYPSGRWLDAPASYERHRTANGAAIALQVRCGRGHYSGYRASCAEPSYSLFYRPARMCRLWAALHMMMKLVPCGQVALPD